MNSGLTPEVIAELRNLARSIAVEFVDAGYGYTMESNTNPAQHRSAYDAAEDCVFSALKRRAGALLSTASPVRATEGEEFDCPRCAGRGRLTAHAVDCSRCGGSGSVTPTPSSDALAERPATKQGIATPPHDDACRLSVMFGRASDLRTTQDIRINEWLKTVISAPRPLLCRDDEDPVEFQALIDKVSAETDAEIKADALAEAKAALEEIKKRAGILNANPHMIAIYDIAARALSKLP